MIVEPKVRGFICLTAHPEGCAKNVANQIRHVQKQPRISGAKKVLVIGASTGYGLASRIMAAFGQGAATLGIMYEKPGNGNRTASAGWYNTAAFERFAHEQDLYAKSINGDAFSAAVKQQAIDLIRQDLGQVDLIIYSLAAPRRILADGTICSSVLKPIGTPYTNTSIDLKDNTLSEITLEPATEAEIHETIKVMGGEDWQDWIRALADANVLSDDTVTLAYSYIGPELTHPIYLNGTIGTAKRHLHATAKAITAEFKQVRAYISVNKALVTQASAAIPVVPLYIALVYRIMKDKGIHENCIQQISRLFHEQLAQPEPDLDEAGLIRMDDWEMRADVQAEVTRLWQTLNQDNLTEHCDITGYWDDFYQMFGFRQPDVDYTQDVEI